MEEFIIKRVEGNYSIVSKDDKYYLKDGKEFLKTPGGKVVNTRYRPIADRLLEDWMSKGYDSYTDPTSILSYHFSAQENFVPLKKSDIIFILNGLNWECHWTLDLCPSANPHVWMEWKSILGDGAVRIDQIRKWFTKCSIMQLTAATCVFNACYSYNLAYIMATIVESIKDKKTQIKSIRKIADFLYQFDPDFEPKYMIEIFNAFRLYYGIHFKEEGPKVITTEH